MPPAAAMIIKPALRESPFCHRCCMTESVSPLPLEGGVAGRPRIAAFRKRRGWRGFPLSSGGKSPVKPAMQSPQSKGAVKKCKSFFHSSYFISCRRQHAFGNPPSPLRGPLPHDKQGGAREYIGARHPPLKQGWARDAATRFLFPP